MIRASAPIRHGIYWACLSLLLLLTACGGGGGGDGGGGGGGVIAVPHVRLALAGNTDGTVSVFDVYSDSGSLRYQGYRKIGDSSIMAIAVHPKEPYAFVLTQDGMLSAYSFNVDNGALTLVNSVAVGPDPGDLALEPVGRFVYATSLNDRTISSFAIDSATGALSAIGTLQVTGAAPVRIALAPSGAYLYVVNRSDDSATVYPRNTINGFLSPPTTVDLGTQPTAMAFNRAGTLAYVTYASSSDNVGLFSVDGSGGLSPVLKFNPGTSTDEPVTVTAGDTPMDIILSNDDTFAYVANVNSNNLTVFGVDEASGELTHVQTVASTQSPWRMAMDIDNKYLYAAPSADSEVSAYSVNSGDGTLTAIDSYRPRTGYNPIALANSTSALSVTAEYLLAPEATVDGYSVDATTGVLDSLTVSNAVTSPVQVTVTLDQRFAYVVSQTKDIEVYQFNATTGNLGNHVQTVAVDLDAVLSRVTIDPSGRFLYALDERSVFGLSGRIYVFAIDQNGGSLTAVQTRATGRNPENLVFHPAGRYLYSIDSYGDTITLFEMNSATGILTQKQTFTPGRTGTGRGRPIQMAFHPNGRYCYVTLEDDRELVRFHISASNGFLESPQRTSTTSVTAFSDGRPRYIGVDPTGLLAYVTLWGGDVSTWTIGTDFGLGYASTVVVPENPSWVVLDPNAHSRFMYVVVKGAITRLSIGSGGALTMEETTPVGTGAASSFSRTATIVPSLQ